MSPLPHKYKICKQLKQKAGLGPQCRDLWQKVLEHARKSAIESTGGDIKESDIESFPFESLPNFNKVKQVNDKENCNPDVKSPSHYNQPQKRKSSDSSITYISPHQPAPIIRDRPTRKSSFESSYSTASLNEYFIPEIPLSRRESNHSLKTLVEDSNQPHYSLNENGEKLMKRMSIGDLGK